MSAANLQKEIDELKAEIHDIKNNTKLTSEDRILCIKANRELIIILENKIEKLSPAMNPTQTGKKMFKVILSNVWQCI